MQNNFSWATINNAVMNICELLLFFKELLQAEHKTTFEVQRTLSPKRPYGPTVPQGA